VYVGGGGGGARLAGGDPVHRGAHGALRDVARVMTPSSRDSDDVIISWQ
jgi:hypothetical protein